MAATNVQLVIIIVNYSVCLFFQVSDRSKESQIILSEFLKVDLFKQFCPTKTQRYLIEYHKRLMQKMVPVSVYMMFLM